MEIRFLEIAQIELDESVEYYNSELTGLGDKFLAEVLHAIDRIRHFPQTWWHPFTHTTCAGSLMESYIRYLMPK